MWRAFVIHGLKTITFEIESDVHFNNKDWYYSLLQGNAS